MHRTPLLLAATILALPAALAHGAPQTAQAPFTAAAASACPPSDPSCGAWAEATPSGQLAVWTRADDPRAQATVPGTAVPPLTRCVPPSTIAPCTPSRPGLAWEDWGRASSGVSATFQAPAGVTTARFTLTGSAADWNVTAVDGAGEARADVVLWSQHVRPTASGPCLCEWVVWRATGASGTLPGGAFELVADVGAAPGANTIHVLLSATSLVRSDDCTASVCAPADGHAEAAGAVGIESIRVQFH
jgi:hypothetical protein